PRPGEVVVDPAAGTAGFLIAAHEHRRGGPDEVYLGNEVDTTVARVAHTNLLLHGMTGGRITVTDSLLHVDADADVVLANPPFAGSVVADRVASFESGTLKTELLFVELIMRRLRRGGRAGVIVPTGVLTATSGAAVWIRRQLVESNRLQAVVELPAGVFRPYTGVKTAVLLWSRDEPAGETLMVSVEHDGYTLDDRREPTGRDDLPAVLDLLAGRDASLPHARVTTSDIAAGYYHLSPSRYVVDHDRPVWGGAHTPLTESLPRVRNAVHAVEAELDHVERLMS
ncbi:MAG: type restriction-modification system subunit HsdM, partial [Aeromicrobium sp.]|nr:type restriction-modification system subunit HsdM [Aeromicrobium sp.]